LLIACAAGTRAQDKAEYDRRGAARYMSLFQSLDRNDDQAVSKLESAGTLEPPRDSRRLHYLRGWSHEHIDEVFTGGPGASRSVGV
jgi:hypothetical protein